MTTPHETALKACDELSIIIDKLVNTPSRDELKRELESANRAYYRKPSEAAYQRILAAELLVDGPRRDDFAQARYDAQEQACCNLDLDNSQYTHDPR